MSASVCREAVGCVLLNVHVAPGVTHPSPPGKQVMLFALLPPGPPVGLAGRLVRDDKHS